MMANKIDFKVAIKVRPLLSKEKNLKSFWRVVNNSIQLIDSQSEPNFFDHVFNQDANNETVFKYIAKDIVHKSIQGMNGTIFAYGQTASGKTYTMMGNSENPGVMVLTAREIFRLIEGITDRKFLLRCGYIEIYNERIYDLLNKKNTDLKIHETPTGLINVNCDEMIITCEEDFLKYLCMGNQERTTGETNMNERSSRSHAIFRVIIESRKLGQDVDDTVTQSVLNLVDLAGSERADQTGARGARLKEGGHINKSLHFLSNVIKSLSENEDDKFISFRDSKLTRILQTSLGGNSLTSIVCTVNPTAVEETQSTLSFARRAKTIKTKPTVNEIVSEATMMKRLELEIKTLKSQLEVEPKFPPRIPTPSSVSKPSQTAAKVAFTSKKKHQFSKSVDSVPTKTYNTTNPNSSPISSFQYPTLNFQSLVDTCVSKSLGTSVTLAINLPTSTASTSSSPLHQTFPGAMGNIKTLQEKLAERQMVNQLNAARTTNANNNAMPTATSNNVNNNPTSSGGGVVSGGSNGNNVNIKMSKVEKIIILD